MAWTTGATLAAKLSSTLGQVVLAWFLVPGDFGAVGLALTVSAFVDVLQSAGSAEILLSRPTRFARWSSIAFWMNLAIGTLAAVVLLALAPVAAFVYEAPRVQGLLTVLAASSVINAVSAIPMAQLRLQMRFAPIATIAGIQAVLRTGLSICLAASGTGAYALVVPVPVTQLIALLLLWCIARPVLRPSLQLRRWRYMIGDSTALVASRLFNMVLWQCDYIALGLFHPERVVGIYVFGFNLSVQSLRLFAGNVQSVMLPALANVPDPGKQTEAFVRAARLLATIAIPASVLQAVVAESVFRLLFAPEYYPSIPVFQALSLGMALRLVATSAGSLMQAKRRFRTELMLQIVYAITFFAVVLAAASRGDELAVAIGASAFFALLGPVHVAVAVADGGQILGNLWKIFGPPMLVSAAAGSATIATATGLAIAFPSTSRPLPSFLLSLGLYTLTCFLLIRGFQRPVWDEVAVRVRRIVPSARLSFNSY